MNTGTKIALAASGGYVLGRTKKMKLAVGLALFLAGRKLPKSPLEMIQQGAGALSKNEQFAELSEQVKGSLLDAGKAAAGRSAERWLAGVSDRLREGIPTPDAGTDQAEGQDTDQDTDQAEGQDTDQEATESQDTEEEEDSQQTDSDSPESGDGNGSESSRQRSSSASGSRQPAKKSGGQSRPAKGA